MVYEVYTLTFSNQSQLTQKKIAPSSRKAVFLPVSEEKVAVMHSFAEVEFGNCRTSHLEMFSDNFSTITSIKRDMNLEVVGLDLVDNILHVLAKRQSTRLFRREERSHEFLAYSYNLTTEEWTEQKCVNRNGVKIMNLELDDILCQPG